MKNYVEKSIKELYDKYSFPESFATTLTKINDEITVEEIEKILSKYQSLESFDIKELSALAEELANKYNYKKETINLYTLVCLVPKLKEFYKQKDISEKIFYDTVNDMRYKYRECMNCEGVDGIRNASFVGWYDTILKMDLFALGRFQYEVLPFRLKEYQKDGNVVREGDKVLSIHIPSSGVPLTDEVRHESYALAKEFFNERFNGKPIPFICWSWLMNPNHDNILDKNSNIVAFMHDFDIIDTEEYEDYNVLSPWIFGKQRVDFDTMPQNSSLQRNIKKHLVSGGKLGWGYGVFFL